MRRSPETLVPFASLLCVSGLNYVFFLVFTRVLSPDDFLGFSAGTAILMPAFAIAEAGVVYAAPPFLRAFTGRKAARIAGALLSISLCILVTTGIAATFLWNQYGDRPADVRWLVRCSLLVAPNLALQNWLLLRMKRPIRLIAGISLSRALPFLAVGSLPMFDGLLALSFLGSSVVFLTSAVRATALNRPRIADLTTSTKLIRQFFVLRFASTIVTSSAPMILGAVASANATAVYLLGDRTRMLVGTLYQPLVQALYLRLCRTDKEAPKLLRIGGVLALIVVLSATLLSANTAFLNSILYGSRHPDPIALALFVVAGHVSVLSSLGYFLVLIPKGHTRGFVGAAIIQAIIFSVLLVSLSPTNEVRYPGVAILVAELSLLVMIGGLMIYYRWSAERARSDGRGDRRSKRLE